jgi:hypothetical protein
MTAPRDFMGSVAFMACPDVPEVVKRSPIRIGSDRASALSASDWTDREALLAAVLENRDEERRFRTVAAISLGRIASSVAEEILVRNLSPRDELPFSEILLSLGRIGGPRALEAIHALELNPRAPATATAAFAETLIAHRLGLPGHDLPLPAETEILEIAAARTRPIEFTPMDSERAREVMDAMRRHPYGIAFDVASLTKIQCAGETHVLCLNSEFLGQAVTRLTRRHAVLALLALQSTETGDYSVSHVILSRPSGEDGALTIMAHRCSGILALFGTARVSDARNKFELRSVRRPGAQAILVKGEIEDSRVTIARAITSIERARRRVPAWQVVPSAPHQQVPPAFGARTRTAP